ncbi:GMC oxidoreductase family protein [Cryptosporidium meleagridis]|uniref:GMC oxidoreductase family protein n=1 Tax=Cryptosporidium meleagridis TaxID=93969 RepID=A0A2P4YZV8_9CRYT|nr:GMC oxidoreductase family protein [Cryptosporidium meleagridis]
MSFFVIFLLKRIILLVIVSIILKSGNTYGIEAYSENGQVPTGMKFDYIIVGAGANGLIIARSLLEKYTRREDEISILIVDKGKEYKENELNDEKQTKDNNKKNNQNNKKLNSSYNPIIDKNDINIYTTEDGYMIFDSNIEGGKTSYGNTPFIPEDVYSGEYYKSLGLNFDSQRLQESFEFVKSVGDIVQPNIRTSWVIALERAFNETGTFHVGDANEEDLAPEDSLFENEITESGYVSSFEIQDKNLEWKTDNEENEYYQDYMITNKDNNLESYNNGGPEYFTSSHYVPYTFLTYGFRRGFERRSATRLLKIDPRLVNHKKLFKILNFHVDKIIFSTTGKNNRENGKFAECIQGARLTTEGYNYSRMKGEVYSKIEKYCIKSGKGKIILSAGALNTPMILQRSGVGSKEDIQISSPGIKNPIIENEYVGKGLRDHPGLSIFGFFRGLNTDHVRIPSSEALFSKRKFGAECKKQEERDDIIKGCESVSISEFEGFTNNISEIFTEQNIGKDCSARIRGVTIRIPNPYSEGEVLWDENNKKPKIRLGLLENINDLLILEAGFRRLVRLFRSINISTLLVPNNNTNKRVNLFGEHMEKKLLSNFVDFGNNNNNYTSTSRAIGTEMNHERCNLSNISLYFGSQNQNYGHIKEKGNDSSVNFYNLEAEKQERGQKEVEEEEEKVANVRKGLEIFDKRGDFSNDQAKSNNGRFNYLKEIHDKLRFQNEGMQSSYHNIMHKFDKSRRDEEKDDETLMEYDASASINNRMDSRYNFFGLRKGEIIINESEDRGKNEEPSLWKSLPFILPKFPSYPEQIREYIKKNVKPGNEFVGTTAIGQVVETDCFRLIGAENIFILDEGVLNKHTSSNPIGTSMILSRYAITKIMYDMC